MALLAEVEIAEGSLEAAIKTLEEACLLENTRPEHRQRLEELSQRSRR